MPSEKDLEQPRSDASTQVSSPLPSPGVDSLAHRLLEAKLLQSLVGDPSEAVRVDRFLIEHELGAGGMGTIYAAWDEQLQRRVALKFLHRVSTDPAGEQRLFREAQALAQLSHPNVVSIHQVGRHEGRVWLAMEHIAGQTLRAWGKEAPRSKAEVLHVWIAAGRGLAAIHAAGLVHRDIKPANIMIGEDGRVRIVDFGLVRLADASQPSASETALSTVAEWSEGLTAHDGFVGTPAYAAPEQVDGGVIDARSDQFAFCVSLWEALCGKRPLRERRPDSQPVLREGERLPKRIHRALARGLMLDPRRRWDDMGELLAALEPRRRRWVVPGVVGSGAAAAGLLAGMTMLGEPAAVAADPCAQAGEGIEVVWTEGRRRAIEAELDPSSTALQALDRWTDTWKDSAAVACAEVHVQHTRAPESLERRADCLERRLAELAVVVEGVAEDPSLVGQLGEPRLCLDTRSLVSAEHATPPPGSRALVSEVRRELARARLGTDTPSLSERQDAANAAHQRAAGLGWSPLIAEAALTVGDLAVRRREPETARKHLGEAIDVAQSTGDNTILADAWTVMAKLGRDLDFDATAVGWALDRRQSVLGRFDASERQLGRLAAERALWHRMQSRPDLARLAFEEAIVHYQASVDGGAEHATMLRDYAELLGRMGEVESAEHWREEARRIQPPDRAHSLSTFNDALGLMIYGDLPGAESTMLVALDQAVREHGPLSAQVTHIYVGLAAVLDREGDMDAAAAHTQQAASLAAVALPDEDPRLADVWSAKGNVAQRQGRPDEAVVAFETELAIREAISAEAGDLAYAQNNLAGALLDAGQIDRARGLLKSSFPVMEREAGNGSDFGPALENLAVVALADDRLPRATELVERALALYDAHPNNPMERAEALRLRTRIELRGGDVASVRMWGQRTVAAYAALAGRWETEIAEIERWMEQAE